MFIVLGTTCVCAQDYTLLHARRSQYEPFNNACPMIDGQRAVVGCVATAVEHIINYWGYPDALQSDIPEYATDKFSLPVVPQGTLIDWEHMQEDYMDATYTEEAASAVADLSLWIGQALKSKYGASSTSASSWNVPDVLRNVFGYKTVEICSRDSYTASAWRRLIENEFNNDRPVYFSGFYCDGGHAWVLDGKKDWMYHCNWGEGNNRDGWYHQDAFNEFQNPADYTYMERFGGCASNQLCICIAPDEVETLAWDSIHTQDFVKVSKIDFLRETSAGGYVLADITIENTHIDTLYYTLEGVSFTPEVWERGVSAELLKDGSYCGVCSFVLPPLSKTKQRACFHFSKTGQRIFTVTFDEEEYFCDTLINVVSEKKLSLEYSDITVSFPEVGTAAINGSVTNESLTATCGTMLDFWLMPGEDIKDEDIMNNTSARYIFLNLKPEETTRYSEQTETHSPILFQGLEVGETYTLWLRQGWKPIVKTLTFCVPSEPSGIIQEVQQVYSDEYNVIYDLSGRAVTSPKGYYIKENKVYWSAK